MGSTWYVVHETSLAVRFSLLVVVIRGSNLTGSLTLTTQTMHTNSLHNCGTAVCKRGWMDRTITCHLPEGGRPKVKRRCAGRGEECERPAINWSVSRCPALPGRGGVLVGPRQRVLVATKDGWKQTYRSGAFEGSAPNASFFASDT